eukprot:TRINITY_DN98471_c0_g1_i1.p1 TRINITY_DN98471_c0_g1~~TRINITY_DN98471_c0_g1_i1.p1  ORF type:complete len:158 (-),score=26.59 TRINITY_DN98471_c0_g1_i1:51-524(-)
MSRLLNMAVLLIIVLTLQGCKNTATDTADDNTAIGNAKDIRNTANGTAMDAADDNTANGNTTDIRSTANGKCELDLVENCSSEMNALDPSAWEADVVDGTPACSAAQAFDACIFSAGCCSWLVEVAESEVLIARTLRLYTMAGCSLTGCADDVRSVR